MPRWQVVAPALAVAAGGTAVVARHRHSLTAVQKGRHRYLLMPAQSHSGVAEAQATDRYQLSVTQQIRPQRSHQYCRRVHLRLPAQGSAQSSPPSCAPAHQSAMAVPPPLVPQP